MANLELLSSESLRGLHLNKLDRAALSTLFARLGAAFSYQEICKPATAPLATEGLERFYINRFSPKGTTKPFPATVKPDHFEGIRLYTVTEPDLVTLLCILMEDPSSGVLDMIGPWFPDTWKPDRKTQAPAKVQPTLKMMSDWMNSLVLTSVERSSASEFKGLVKSHMDTGFKAQVFILASSLEQKAYDLVACFKVRGKQYWLLTWKNFQGEFKIVDENDRVCSLGLNVSNAVIAAALPGENKDPNEIQGGEELSKAFLESGEQVMEIPPGHALFEVIFGFTARVLKEETGYALSREEPKITLCCLGDDITGPEGASMAGKPYSPWVNRDARYTDRLGYPVLRTACSTMFAAIIECDDLPGTLFPEDSRECRKTSLGEESEVIRLLTENAAFPSHLRMYSYVIEALRNKRYIE